MTNWSGNSPAADDSGDLYANPAKATTLPPQTAPTIGDRLSAKDVRWIWYAGAWDDALKDGRAPSGDVRRVIYAPQTPAGSPDTFTVTFPEKPVPRLTVTVAAPVKPIPTEIVGETVMVKLPTTDASEVAASPGVASPV